jgi:hypothetical protein
VRIHVVDEEKEAMTPVLLEPAEHVLVDPGAVYVLHLPGLEALLQIEQRIEIHAVRYDARRDVPLSSEHLRQRLVAVVQREDVVVLHALGLE